MREHSDTVYGYTSTGPVLAIDMQSVSGVPGTGKHLVQPIAINAG